MTRRAATPGASSRGTRPSAAWVRTALLACALLLGGWVEASAQQAQTDVPQRERLLEKIRARETAIRRPSADTAAADTVAADSAATPSPQPPRAERAVPANLAKARPARPATEDSAGPPAVRKEAPDSIRALLLALEGYTVTEYSGTGGRFDADSGRVVLLGRAELSRGEQRMTADSLLVYDQNTMVVCGYGKPVLTGDEGTPVESDQVCYDTRQKIGVALGAKTRFSQGTQWIVHGDRVFTAGTNRLYGQHARFTDCDIEEPHYHFAAARVKLINDDVLVARDVTLKFADVPVFWLPFVVQSLKQGRRSGILMPRFGINDIIRTDAEYRRRIENVGFYWAINDYMGAQVALGWESNSFTQLAGSFDYNWPRQFLRGGINFSQYWRATGGTALTLSTNNSWRATERTSVNISANFASSEQFVRRHSYDPRQITQQLSSNAGFSHRFDWGSLSVSASRQQYLNDGRVDYTFPNASLSLSNITLFKAPPGSARWYNNATWVGSASFSSRGTRVGEGGPSGGGMGDRSSTEATLNSSFNLGNVSWSQQLMLTNRRDRAREADTIPPPACQVGQCLDWSTSLGYTQRFLGTSTITPSLSLSGRVLKAPFYGNEAIPAPTRLNFAAALQTSIYGFWPGVGPFSRIRHWIQPMLNYTYSPAQVATDRQREVFGVGEVGEQNRLTITINQTIEAKFKDSGPQPGDSAAADSLAGETGGPRRRPQARKMRLLSFSTSAIVYNFAARDTIGDRWAGFETRDLSHTVSSDLLPGLTLSFGENLFRTDSAGRRRLDPHLTNLNASFSLRGDSWLFRVLGLAGRPARRTEQPDSAEAEEAAADSTSTPPGGIGGLPPTRSSGGALLSSWSASFSYSLYRPRNGPEHQMLQATMSFQPTENWRVNWQTGYSFTERKFSDHVLSLTRRLHDWDANFSFVKTQTGNFSFMFNVHLRANSAIKLDWRQRGGPGTGF